jgi:hypothetical protein
MVPFQVDAVGQDAQLMQWSDKSMDISRQKDVRQCGIFASHRQTLNGCDWWHKTGI